MCSIEKESVSDREEGEIVDELDDLSDISSEEEYLLRQRLQVLENFNKVLERKEAKKFTRSEDSPRFHQHETFKVNDLSDISGSNFDSESFSPIKNIKEKPTNYKHKRKKVHTDDHLTKNRNVKRKLQTKKIVSKPVNAIVIKDSQSSEESDYEYREKRRKLMNAVIVSNKKKDTSLKARISNMLSITKNKNKKKKKGAKTLKSLKTQKEKDENFVKNFNDEYRLPLIEMNKTEIFIDNVLKHTADTSPILSIEKPKPDTDEVDGIVNHNSSLSDDDLEQLRVNALKSKTQKHQENTVTQQNKSIKNSIKSIPSEDEDSDTAELRLICLRSTLLKKAMEMKIKQKMRKRLSQSMSLYDEIIAIDEDLNNEKVNNTDNESVDMDIGSEGEQDTKGKEIIECNNDSTNVSSHVTKPQISELDEDEDLLRAQLLTSLTKSLPIMKTNSTEDIPNVKLKQKEKSINIPPEKRFIINTANSDSEGEHEATKNLTKMHLKLSESVDFQDKLDSFLKLTRMEVEKTLPEKTATKTSKAPEKFVPKVVNHLPKSEQIEYQNLVKRMAELERIKQTRQQMINSNKAQNNVMLAKKPTDDNHATVKEIQEQINLSRKKIAEESSKVLKLKEEGTNLSQKFKIVATELRNLRTAITFNKKQQKSAQINLSQMQNQHQLLLKRSKIANQNLNTFVSVPNQITENKTRLDDPTVQEKHVKSKQTELVKDNASIGTSIDESKNRVNKEVLHANEANTNGKSTTDIETVSKIDSRVDEIKSMDSAASDYKSPLQAFNGEEWKEDPNGILCPFDVAGSCKDTNCKYLHPKTAHTH